MEIIHLYDSPHLLKGMRNNFLTKDLQIIYEKNGKKEKMIESWDAITAAYILDIKSGNKRTFSDRGARIL